MSIIIVPIEPIETRYTGHWYDFLPKQIAGATGEQVIQIDGCELSQKPSSGAFLNFTSTVYYKSMQSASIAKLFHEGSIKNNDTFLVTDAWNPSSHFIRYIADLCDVNVRICGIWHAGSYDPWDFLGRKFKDKDWSYDLEKSLFALYDFNFFATEYHKNLFESEISGVSNKNVRIGFPMEYYPLDIKFVPWEEKKNRIVFPHRISVEKKPDLFEEISKYFPEYEFIFSQKVCSNKNDYHRLLESSKIVFSANLQETLGISMYEGMLAGCVPIVPNSLSYNEMYHDTFRYDLKNEKEAILSKITDILKHPYLFDTQENLKKIQKRYFTGTKLYRILKS